jgi:ADP-ribose pyrophosphatase YjhB (NUDIX family)
MIKRVHTQTFVVAGAIIEKDGKILLVQENQPGKPAHGKWNHPAGWVEVGEDPIESAKKEVMEEAGMEFIPERLLGLYSIVKKSPKDGSVIHPIKLIFTGRLGKKKGKLAGDTLGARWFSPEEIYRMDSKTLRDADIKQIVRDYFSGKRYSLEVVRHMVSK